MSEGRDVFAEGTGNIFADIGLPDPDWHLVKADLAIRIADTIGRRGMTTADAASIAGVAAADLGRITDGHFDDVGVDVLLRVLNALGVAVAIVATDMPDWQAGRTRFVRCDGRD